MRRKTWEKNIEPTLLYMTPVLLTLLLLDLRGSRKKTARHVIIKSESTAREGKIHTLALPSLATYVAKCDCVRSALKPFGIFLTGRLIRKDACI